MTLYKKFLNCGINTFLSHPFVPASIAYSKLLNPRIHFTSLTVAARTSKSSYFTPWNTVFQKVSFPKVASRGSTYIMCHNNSERLSASFFSTSAVGDIERDEMDFDVIIVGGGPSGLAASIKIMQVAQQAQKSLSVCIVEKGSEIGAHILSGNVYEPRALLELFPDALDSNNPDPPPLNTPVTEEEFHILTPKYAIPFPHLLLPPVIHNKGNYVISLGNLCKWLSRKAEELGVDIYPGFAASELLFNEDGGIRGVQIADVGIAKSGELKSTFEPGMRLLAKQTIFAEGCRGSLSEQLMKHFNLRENVSPQQYGIGLKEIWELQPEKHKEGYIRHSVGWPLSVHDYGGIFLYHMQNNLLHIGLVIGLDYRNPYISPYNEFQRAKHHSSIKPMLEGGRCISYGARCLNEGGLQAIPKLTFPGGILIGDAAGFMNVPKIKGSHTAMKSGIVGGEAVANALLNEKTASYGSLDIDEYPKNLRKSWLWQELKAVRNAKPSFKYGKLFGGLGYSGFSLFISGREPWTFTWSHTDSESTDKAFKHKPIEYPKPDGVISFDLLENLSRSGTNHEHDQPSHLKIKAHLQDAPVNISYNQYAGPESRFCPAKVYEFLNDEATGDVKLQINAQNCLHCKCCSIKTPAEYINWTVPEGGGGPAYSGM